MRTDRGRRGVLVRFVQLEIAPGFVCGPAEDQRQIVDQRGLGELFERLLVVRDIHHRQENPQIVFSRQGPDARVDVLRVQAVVLETEEQGARRRAQHIVGRDVAVLPWQLPHRRQDRIAFLSRRHEDGGRARAGRQRLRGRLLDFGGVGGGGGGRRLRLRRRRTGGLLDGCNGSSEVGIVAKVIVHDRAKGENLKRRGL